MLCEMCQTDEATEEHHILPRSRGGRHLDTLDCCSDCGGQVHMLFNNNDLSKMSLDELLAHEKIIKYIKWKQKHPGVHKHRMSAEVKEWRRYHR